MRIGFVTQWFPPEPGTLVAGAIADGLASRGHHVDVVTGFPNYPSGKFQEGYPLKSYRRDSRSSGVTVHRSPLYPSHDRSATKRTVNYASFALAASWVARYRVPSPDVWLVYSSPATAVIPAIVATLGLRTPICLLIEDLWPDSVLQSGMVSSKTIHMIGAGLHAFCQWSYRRASGIGVISPSMRDVLLDRGVEPGRLHYTPNWIDDDASSQAVPSAPELRRQLGLPAGRLFMYAGNMGELQGLEPLVRAFRYVPAARLVLVGAGVCRNRLENIVHDEQITNVTFVDSQSSASIGRYIRASEVQVVSLKDTPLLRATMPSKVQSSLAAGKPLLVHAAGDAAQLVSENRLGIACQPGDLASTVEAIKHLTSLSASEVTALGRKSRDFYQDHFSSSVGLDRLERLLSSGAAPNSSDGSNCGSNPTAWSSGTQPRDNATRSRRQEVKP